MQVHNAGELQWPSDLERIYAKGVVGKSAPTVQDGTATEAGLLSYPVRGYLATARVRAGITASSDVYVTGGAGFTRFEMDIANGHSRIAFTNWRRYPVWGSEIESAYLRFLAHPEPRVIG